jgi:hypothetical protein
MVMFMSPEETSRERNSESLIRQRDIWVAVEVGHNLIHKITFDEQKAAPMALKSLVRFHEFREFQVNDEERIKIIQLANKSKWSELYDYLVEKGFLMKTFTRR